ncbi:MAG: hypothetical protein LBQ02_02670 [Candidatus Nomurabacteria bacterium]|jgi:hypothetical protein|nr:hypothetical protein [Candidatus Nomurabacteria bacterium]
MFHKNALNYDIDTGAESATLVCDILDDKPLLEQDLSEIEKIRKEITHDDDEGGEQLYNGLREWLTSLDTDAGWDETKAKARQELGSLSPNVLDIILQRVSPLMKELPAGHSKGHALRDSVNITKILGDKNLEHDKLDEVELLTGIIGGMIHDIGISIVDRYAEVNAVIGHAEVGAVLADKYLSDIIPNNLRKLLTYNIAAHTNYQKDRAVVLSDGHEAVAKTYGGKDDRYSLWLTRAADRNDAAGMPSIVRNIAVNATNIQEYNGDSFDRFADEKDSFIQQFDLSPDNAKILKHINMFATNFYKNPDGTGENIYNKYDSPHFTKLVSDSNKDTLLFFAIISDDAKNELIAKAAAIQPDLSTTFGNLLDEHKQLIEQYQTKEINDDEATRIWQEFRSLCHKIEPAKDLDDKLDIWLDKANQWLSASDRDHWLRGFAFLTENIFPRWRNETEKLLAHNLQLGKKIESNDDGIKELFTKLGDNLQNIAEQSFRQMTSK